MSNNTTHLSPSQRDTLHKKLIDRQMYCRSKLAELRGEREACARGGEVGNFGDRSMLATDFHRTIEDAARIEGQLRAVSSALRRFGDDYGLCLECGGEIDPRRLEFDPTIERCIECAELGGSRRH